MAPGFSALAGLDPSSAKASGRSLLRESSSHRPPGFPSISIQSVNIANQFRIRISNRNWGATRSIHVTGRSSFFRSKTHPMLACMAARDPYEILGVSKNASISDIKEAFDREKADVERERREINEAYEVLKNKPNHSDNHEVEAGPNSPTAADVFRTVSGTIIEDEVGPKGPSASDVFWKVLSPTLDVISYINLALRVVLILWALFLRKG